jgi:AcrR family transcriptional regulator
LEVTVATPRSGRSGNRSGGSYHHGNLRGALVEGALDLLAAGGLNGFSVAAAARHVGVSSAAPYRHFPDRESLLAAVAAAAARQLTELVRAAAERAGDDPVERLAATAGAYARFVIERRAGLDVILAPGLQDRRFTDLHEQSRALMSELLQLVLAASTAGSYQESINLLEYHLAQAHGYATMLLDGAFAQHGHTTDEVERKTVAAARTLIVGHRALHPG